MVQLSTLQKKNQSDLPKLQSHKLGYFSKKPYKSLRFVQDTNKSSSVKKIVFTGINKTNTRHLHSLFLCFLLINLSLINFFDCTMKLMTADLKIRLWNQHPRSLEQVRHFFEISRFVLVTWQRIIFVLKTQKYPFASQKQSLEVFCKKRCFQNFRKFHRKTPVLKYLLNKGIQLY